MEALTPIQRVAVIAVGLTLTLACAIFVLPWAGRQIIARLPPTATPLPATATPLPTATPAQQAIATPTATVALTPSPPKALLELTSHEFQAQKDGASASLGIALSYWGHTALQEEIALAVRPGGTDTNVELEELAAYARAHELAAHVAVNGRIETLHQLLANGFPIIAARWITTTEGVGTRQVQVVRGYDRTSRMLTVHDPSVGPEVTSSYAEMDEEWRALNRQYLLVFPSEQRERVRTILNADWTEATMWENALARAEEEIQGDTRDAYAWLNRASALVALKQYEEARAAFDRAQQLGLPAGLTWYRFDLYECLLNLGAYDHLLTLTQAAVNHGTTLEQLHLYRAQAYVALGDADRAREEYRRALDIHPDWKPAEEGLSGLPE